MWGFTMTRKNKMITIDEKEFDNFMTVVNPKNFSSWISVQMVSAVESMEEDNDTLLEEIKESTELLWLYMNRERFEDFLHFLGVYNSFINSTGSIMNKKQVQQFLKRVKKSEEDFSELEIIFLKSASVCPVCFREFSTERPKMIYNKALNFNVCSDCLTYRVKDIDPCLAEFKRKILGSDV